MSICIECKTGFNNNNIIIVLTNVISSILGEIEQNVLHTVDGYILHENTTIK